ncbi:hypothetical protein AZE42_11379 [Rhizopogon vesiculosus]|uniref:Uncharacterized protein n=1 Tax=Rhizopogon vesiculosus TaxID=180088 RepID=A0A1J8PIW3_9AGAM|nr:hypothetical protein AZE42_11379 [Rhizopogon vesiculosus]
MTIDTSLRVGQLPTDSNHHQPE